MSKLNPDQKFVVQAKETLDDRLHVDVAGIARDLAMLPSTVQHRLWLVICNLLRIWAALADGTRPDHPLAGQYRHAQTMLGAIEENLDTWA